MTVVADRVRRMRIANEPTGSFGVEIGIGSFSDCAFREDSLKLTMNRPMESPMLSQQILDGYPSKVFLPRDAQLDFATNLRPLTQRCGNAAASAGTIAPDNQLWATAMQGAQYNQIGTTIASTSTTSVLNVTSGAGLFEGGAIACATGAGGALECREIKTISSNVVTVKHAFSSIPANGSTVYAPGTFYLSGTTGTVALSLQAAIEGIITTDRWLLKGGQIKSPPAFDFAPGTVPKVTWSFGFADWDPADGTNTTMNLNAALADQNYADTGIQSVMDSEFRVMTAGTTAIASTLIEATSMTITPSIKYVPHKTVSGLNTVKQWVRVRPDGPPVTGEFTVPFEDQSWFTARDNETERSIFFQIGSSVAGGAVLISVPRVCIDDVQREELDGISGQRIKWYAKSDNQTTTNSSELQKSAFRVHLF